MELLQVFDKNRNMINEYIERDKKKTLANGKYFMIILLFIQNSDNKFLIQKVADENIYATTGGHVSYGDNSLKTVIKECYEELGLKLHKEELKLIEQNTIACCHIDIYYVKKDFNIKDLKLQKEEVDDVYWLSKDEIYKLINEEKFRKGNINPFNNLIKKLN